MRKIPLVGERGKGKFALIDDDQFDKVSNFKWIWNGRYVATFIKVNGVQKTLLLHRYIFGEVDGEIDHKDHNALNNTRENLRVCTRSQNLMNRKIGKNNSSGYKGVYFDKWKNKWRAYIYLNKKQIILGWFDEKIDAARYYNVAAIKYHGQYARLNKID
ncbi:MAG TPA: HNH endonuclease [Chloroflexia bacterium]|nr:HNH endonuclease [Chloroflexia bacterium]